jgi:GNAT superfamily N-acetyltransferase
MQFREATIEDIPMIQVVRHAVKENRLSDPSLVPDKDVEDYINRRGKGWVCIADGRVIGFSIVSLIDKNVWALFVDPSFEKKAVGRTLQNLMLNWYFSQTADTLWLGTAPGTRAELFYRSSGWSEVGMHGKGEIKFEMTKDSWLKQYSSE